MTAHDLAFPLHALGTTATGLTKRELFAAMIFANGWSPALPAEVAAKAAVVGADALLAELAKDGAP